MTERIVRSCLSLKFGYGGERPDPQTVRGHPVTALLVATAAGLRTALYRESGIVL